MNKRRPPFYCKDDLVLVSESPARPPRPAVVDHVKVDHTGEYSYRVKGSADWHTEGNLQRAED